MRQWLSSIFVLLAAAAFVASDTSAQPAETRVALIIANEAYSSPSLGRLPGTQTDAGLMRAALERAGFAVTVRTNLNRAQMRDALSDFRGRLSQLGQNGVGFLYYSGHGIADGPRGQNYLVPVDASIRNVTDLPTTSLALNEELDGIVLAGARATIIVIDACRNTPVSLGRGSRGLAAVPARTDTLIAFSTDAGDVATDEGIYARTLAQELGQPNADAATVFARVQNRVALETQRAQRPRYDNGLVEPFVFVAGATGAPPPAPASTPRDPAAAVVAALGRIPQHDWQVTNGYRLAERVLAEVPLGSVEQLATRDVRARLVLGWAYDAGVGGVQSDAAEAVRQYRLAADQGSARAQSALGTMYLDGRGVPRDDAEALRLYRLAANAGHPGGIANLAYMYGNGVAVARDDVEAVRLYRLAAEQGVALAQYNLGAMHERGMGGLTANRAEAVLLYQLAARQGYTQAQQDLARLGETW